MGLTHGNLLTSEGRVGGWVMRVSSVSISKGPRSVVLLWKSASREGGKNRPAFAVSGGGGGGGGLSE